MKEYVLVVIERVSKRVRIRASDLESAEKLAWSGEYTLIEQYDEEFLEAYPFEETEDKQ